jgi:hypothetical protein
MPKLYLILGWIVSTVATIVVASLSVQALIVAQKEPIVLDSFYQPMVASSEVAYTPTVGEVKGIETTMAGEDARAEIVANFLERHDSPLLPADEYGRKLVDIADRHGIDFRFLPAIAMQESNLCKKIPPGSYNCLGFGIHERGTLMFDNYEANFERAARELKANYIDQGLDTPEKIMHKYTPSSNGSWAESVKQWMAEMRYDDRQKGRDLKRNSSVLEFAGEPSTESTPLE